ncbi:V-type proton ATPase subunit H isoform X1 [Hydra vulgaris]|nr:unnamed protein product [Hydra vulgaris]XP_047145815.1 V-type proton ATPase subunit H [Hydra vulgaris]
MITPDISVYHTDLAPDGSKIGVIMTRLETKLIEIRAYRVNWESYLQGDLIQKSDYQFINHYYQQNSQEREKLFQQDPDQCVLAIWSILTNVAKEHILQYTLVMIDDILSNSKGNAKIFYEAAKKNSIIVWSSLINLLMRDDQIIMHMASRLIAKFARLSRHYITDSDLTYYINWLKVQLAVPGNEHLQSVAECIQWILQVDEYRLPFVEANGINSIVSVLLSSLGFQLQYQLIFSLWMLSFHVKIAGIIADGNVITVLADIMRNSEKEKVTRIIIATFRNLLEKAEDSKAAAVSLIHCKLLPLFDILAKKNWGDEDIREDIEFITEKLNASVQDLSTWDEYVAEVKSGRLEWSPVHRQEKFWRENAIKITDGNYELLKMLVRLLESSDDPVIKAVACHDLGEFIRHYPRGRPAFDQLGCKSLLMNCMTHDDLKVRYEALISVQKLMVHNWEFLGKQVKIE